MKPREVGALLLLWIASNPTTTTLRKILSRIKPLTCSSLSAPHAQPSGVIGTPSVPPQSRLFPLLASLALLPLTTESNPCGLVFEAILGRLLFGRSISRCSLASDVSGDLRNSLASSDAAPELDKCRFIRLSSEGSVRFSGDGGDFEQGKIVGLDLPRELPSMPAVEEGQIQARPRDANGTTLATADTQVFSDDGDVSSECTDRKICGVVETCGSERRTDEEIVRTSAEDDLEQEKILTYGLEGAEDGKGISKRLKIEFPVDLATSICLHNDHIQAAWEHWRKLREPKLIVAPMVDQSELPFRMLCRKYGATAAYTPMLHSRLFVQDPKYRSSEFSTCPEDRPLFVQFCANNPNTLLEAARIVEPYCDYVDINLGCPQRIAKRGNYGAFLMDDLPLIRTLVSTLAKNLSVPVSCKIRLFPCIEETLSYARMLEEAGCSLLAVHGRTRDQKDSKAVRADWDAIRAVKNALHIPVLANGNIRWLNDVHTCLSETGADGMLSAESLLENPALFAGYRLLGPFEQNTAGCPENPQISGCGLTKNLEEDSSEGVIDPTSLLLEYLHFCEKHPVPPRMIRAHVHRILGNWFRAHPDLRESFNKEYKFTFKWLREMVHQMCERNKSLNLNLKAVQT